jgi:cell division protein FtsI (penicillin-binding protein 3)
VISAPRPALMHVRSFALAQARMRALWVLVIFAALALMPWRASCIWGWLIRRGRARWRWRAAARSRRDHGPQRHVAGARLSGLCALVQPKALGDGSRWCIPRGGAALVRIFPDEDVDALTKRLATGKPGYLRRRILPEEANRVHALGEPALEFPRENERYYPQGTMAAHILGYVDNRPWPGGHGSGVDQR